MILALNMDNIKVISGMPCAAIEADGDVFLILPLEGDDHRWQERIGLAQKIIDLWNATQVSCTNGVNHDRP